MNAVIIQHEEREGPVMLKPALQRAGFNLQHRFREVRPADMQAELVVVMGGPMGVYEANRFPFLTTEVAMLRERLVANRCCVGICLGAQLLASAAGARVYPGQPGFELGVHPVELTAAARADPAFRDLPSGWNVAHWHGDTFDPVPDAISLASTRQYEQQAFRIGNSLGLQFHPELDAETFVRWITAAPEDVSKAGKNEADLLRTEVPKLRAAERINASFLENLARQLLKTGAASG